MAIKRFLYDHEVKILTGTKLVEICETGLVLDTEGVKRYLPCDAVVIFAGYHPNDELEKRLAGIRGDLVVVGDAAQCTNAMEAAYMGFDAGYNA